MRGRRGLPAEMELDAGNQFANEEGLDYIVVGAEFQAHDAIGFRGARGQEDDGNGGQLGIRADGFADSRPSESGSMMSRMMRSGRSWRQSSSAPFPVCNPVSRSLPFRGCI